MTFGQDPTPQTANEWVRANVRELMDLRRWTQVQLAERLKVSQPWLSKRLTGTTPFQIEDLDMFAAAFGLSPQELLCAGFGKWDRRNIDERRTGRDRRRQPRS
jgi:transcriptional regulator with XRE-family HTH domain